jgi:hypothetical protein
MIQSSPRLKRSLELLLLGTAAGVAVACGSQVSDMAGDIAEEVGDMLSDAGSELIEAGSDMLDRNRDAQAQVEDIADAAERAADAMEGAVADGASPLGEMLTEAGAVLMTDAGELLRDAGALLHEAGVDAHESGSQMASDASAQSCATCASGALRALPASENPEQQLGGSRARGTWSMEEQVVDNVTVYALYAALGDGPMVLTDIERSHGGTAVTNVYAVPRGSACATYSSSTRQYVIPAQARTLLLPATNSSVHGAHLNVRASERACVLASSSNSLLAPSETANQNSTATVIWSGYRLYE